MLPRATFEVACKSGSKPEASAPGLMDAGARDAPLNRYWATGFG
jgi:hypothetical protein